MAKARSSASTKSSVWPATSELKPWLECYLKACERHPKPQEIGAQAGIRLKQLAECGEADAALRMLDRFLAKLPKSECQATGWLALSGASICFDFPEERRARKYLELAESRRAIAKPAMRRALEINLTKLREANGEDLPDDVDEPDDEELYAVGRQRRRYREALAANDKAGALKALQKAAKLVLEVDDFLLQRGLILSIIRGFVRLAATAELSKYVSAIDRAGEGNDLDTGALLAMGLRDVANKRAESRIVGHLKKLKLSRDSNIHFPVNEICTELWFLLQTGERPLATKLLRRTLRELPTWPALAGGFSASGALTLLAEPLAEIDGPEAAVQLLGLATTAAKAEPHRGFRRSAVKAAAEPLPAPGLAAAIEKAASIKSAAKRRDELIPLLTRKCDWPALGKVLDELKTPDEVCAALHSVIYKIPGGPRIN